MISFFKKTVVTNTSKPKSNEVESYRQMVSENIQSQLGYKNFFLTKSCTQSLELALMTLNFPAGKEVILPSYGFVSIANVLAINGLKCVFVDCEPGTMNIDIKAIVNAITDETVAVITINYGGVACDYDRLLPICKEKGIYIIEDNAHGIRAKYKGRYLGSFGDVSTISFDYLKNITCDEGGGISINDSRLLPDFEVSYFFGTNKASFMRNEAPFYEWKGRGTNSLLAEPLAEILYKQVMQSEIIINHFKRKWNYYYEELKNFEQKGYIELAKLPDYSEPNGHMFWIKVENESIRKKIMSYLFRKDIQTAFHYTPLHLSEYGKKVGEFRGVDKFTSKDSFRLLRLPLYYDLSTESQVRIIEEIDNFYRQF